MSIDTFNPNSFVSASEAMQALRGEGIQLNHRLGARVYALGRRAILFSMAFLEEAAESEDFGACLRDKRWNSAGAENTGAISAILEPLGAWYRIEDGCVCVYTEDEQAGDAAETALAAVSEGAVAPKVMGGVDLSAIKGVLWDRRRLEESSLVLLDSEDTQQLIEAFRYLFRAALSCSQDPSGLLVTAFKRGHAELSAEAARQVRDNVDRDFGRALLGLLSEDAQKFKDALYYFNRSEQEACRPVLKVLLLPALIPLVSKEGFRTHILPGLPQLAPLLAGCSRSSESGGDEEFRDLTEFIDALLDNPEPMEMAGRFAVSAFIFDLAPHFSRLPEYLLKRFRSTEAPADLAFYGNILSRLKLDDDGYSEVKARLVRLFAEHGADPGLSRRLRSTFRFLGTEVLFDLSNPKFMAGLDESRRMFVAGMWNDFRTAAGYPGLSDDGDENDDACGCCHDHSDEACSCGCHTHSADEECACHGHDHAEHSEEAGHCESADHARADGSGQDRDAAAGDDADELLPAPADLLNASFYGRGPSVNSPEMNELFAEFVLARLSEKDKASTLTLVHTGQLDLPAVKEKLASLDAGRFPIYSFLFEEACRMEDPDDRKVLDLLASCGDAALEFSFKVISADAALESGGEAGKIAVFGRLLHLLDFEDEKRRGRVREMIGDALNFPCLRKYAAEEAKHPLVPAVWQALGLLGSSEPLEEDVRRRIVDMISLKIGIDPKPKIDAMLAVYRNAGRDVKAAIESDLRKVFEEKDPDRKVLEFSLEGLHKLLEDGPMPVEIEALISVLCRTVLAKGKEPSLEDLMRRVLSGEAEGDGVQMPQAWSHADRTAALRILGAAACHSDASERLHRMLVYRLFSFLDDWFEGIEKGQNLYAYRSNPIWGALTGLLERDRSEFALELARNAALRLMSDFKRGLEGADLSQSESGQKFLLSVLRTGIGAECTVNGIKLELDRAVLKTLIEAAIKSPADNKVAFFLLQGLAEENVLPDPLQEELEAYLAACGRG